MGLAERWKEGSGSQEDLAKGLADTVERELQTMSDGQAEDSFTELAKKLAERLANDENTKKITNIKFLTFELTDLENRQQDPAKKKYVECVERIIRSRLATERMWH